MWDSEWTLGRQNSQTVRSILPSFHSSSLFSGVKVPQWAVHFRDGLYLWWLWAWFTWNFVLLLSGLQTLRRKLFPRENKRFNHFILVQHKRWTEDWVYFTEKTWYNNRPPFASLKTSAKKLGFCRIKQAVYAKVILPDIFYHLYHWSGILVHQQEAYSQLFCPHEVSGPGILSSALFIKPSREN